MKTYQLYQGKIRFVCESCRAKRPYTPLPETREYTITCHRCGTKNLCKFNRRSAPRKQQSGTLSAITANEQILEIQLADISLFGVGFFIQHQDTQRIQTGEQLNFFCDWDKQLLANKTYAVRSIRKQRVGAEQIH